VRFIDLGRLCQCDETDKKVDKWIDIAKVSCQVLSMYFFDKSGIDISFELNKLDRSVSFFI